MKTWKRKKRIRGLKCYKLIVTFNLFLSSIIDPYDKKDPLGIKYFDIRDMYDITRNENIREVEYRYQSLYALVDDVLNVIASSVQPILSFVFSKSYDFKELTNILLNNNRCRILKISGAHIDDLHFYARNSELVSKLRIKNFVLLHIEGLSVSSDVTTWLQRNRKYFKNTQERVKKENVERVNVLREKFYFPRI